MCAKADRNAGREEEKLGWLGKLDGTKGKSEGEETERERFRGRERTVTRGREKKEKDLHVAFSLRRFSFCYGSFYTSLFRPFEICTNTGATTSKGEERRQKKMKRRQKERERERGGGVGGEENGKVLSFFRMSQAQVRRREKDGQKAE